MYKIHVIDIYCEAIYLSKRKGGICMMDKYDIMRRGIQNKRIEKNMEFYWNILIFLCSATSKINKKKIMAILSAIFPQTGTFYKLIF